MVTDLRSNSWSGGTECDGTVRANDCACDDELAQDIERPNKRGVYK